MGPTSLICPIGPTSSLSLRRFRSLKSFLIPVGPLSPISILSHIILEPSIGIANMLGLTALAHAVRYLGAARALPSGAATGRRRQNVRVEACQSPSGLPEPALDPSAPPCRFRGRPGARGPDVELSTSSWSVYPLTSRPHPGPRSPPRPSEVFLNRP
eukprot:4356033-Pyramimonas_sp.AAC.1